MGPAATVRLNARIIAGAQGLYGAVEDHEFPEVITVSLAGPYLNHIGVKHFKHRSLIVAMQQGAQRLERAGASVLVIPCNTVHQPRILQEITTTTSELVSMVDMVVDEVVARSVTKVGIIASEDSMKYGVYSNALRMRGLEPIDISSYDQHRVNQVIHRAMGGLLSKQDVKVLGRIQRDLIERGAEVTILGCTELSLLYDDLSHNTCLIDSIEVTAKAVLQKATERKKSESLQLANR